MLSQHSPDYVKAFPKLIAGWILLQSVAIVGIACAMPQPIRPRVPAAPSTMTLVSPNGRHVIELVASDKAAFIRLTDRQTNRFSVITTGPGQPYIAVSDSTKPYPDVLLIDEGLVDQRPGAVSDGVVGDDGKGNDKPARAKIGATEE